MLSFHGDNQAFNYTSRYLDDLPIIDPIYYELMLVISILLNIS